MARDTVTVPRELLEEALEYFTGSRMPTPPSPFGVRSHGSGPMGSIVRKLNAALLPALQSVEGGVQGSIATKQESCPESAPRTETASFLQRASDILEKHLDPDGGDIYIAHLGSRRAIQIVTAFADEIASIATRSAKLIALADAIRAAQRAYMADRGNHEKGKAVAAAAAAYDASRTKSAPPFLAPHNSGEREPPVMPDSGGADTKSDGGAT